MEINNEVAQCTHSLPFSGSVLQLLQTLHLNPETVLVTRNDEVLTEDETVEDNDSITILSVISGG